MAKPIQTVQKYPRYADSDLLDETSLQPHQCRIPAERLREIIVQAIQTANRKSRRVLLDIGEDASDEEASRLYETEGRKLFEYFREYCSDPAEVAHQCLHRHYTDVAQEQFRNRKLQSERMNSAWRYQYIARDAALASKRFDLVSDIGTAEADFNVAAKYTSRPSRLTIYVSVKNRTNTMGGQDWPKAIRALEDLA